MKKYILIILCACLLITMTACSSKSNEETTQKVTEKTEGDTNVAQTTMPLVTDDVSTAKKSKEKSDNLKKDIKKVINGGENSSLEVNETGHFTYQNVRDATIVYSQERSDNYEKGARELANKIIDSISSYYNELSFEKEDIINVGRGENGIDSVSYNYYYVSSSEGEIRIQIDSDGVLSFIECGCNFK